MPTKHKVQLFAQSSLYRAGWESLNTHTHTKNPHEGNTGKDGSLGIVMKLISSQQLSRAIIKMN